MAESEDPVSKDDVMIEGAFDPAIEGAKLLLENVTNVERALRTLAQESAKFFTSSIKSLQQLEEFNTKATEMQRTEKALLDIVTRKVKLEKEVEALEAKKLKSQQEEQKLAQQKIKTEKEAQRLAEQLEKANKKRMDTDRAVSGEYKRQSKELNNLIAKYYDLALAGKQNHVVAKGLLQTIQEQDAKLKALDATVGRHQRNVGHYEKGLKGLNGALFGVFKLLGLQTEGLEQIEDGMNEAVKVAKEFSRAQKELTIVQKALQLLQTGWGAVIGVAVGAIAALTIAVIEYREEIFGVSEAETKRRTALDGMVIKDDELREAHNKSIRTIRDLRVEYDLASGSITEFQASVIKLKNEYTDALEDIARETTKQIEEKTGFWESLKTFALAGGNLATAVNRQLNDIQEIVNKANIKADDARKERDAKIAVERAKKDKEERDKLEEQRKKEADEAGDFFQKITNEREQSVKDNRDELRKINKDANEKDLKELQKNADEEMKQLEAQANEQFKFIVTNEQKKIDAKKKLSEEELKRRREFEEELLGISFDVAKKKLGNSEADQRRLKQLNELEIISELGLAYYNLFQQYSKDSTIKNPSLKAAQETFSAKALGKLISTAAGLYEGTDSVSREDAIAQIPRSKDNLLVPLHEKERVIGVKQSARIAGMTNEEVVRAAEQYRERQVLQDRSMAEQVAGAQINMLRQDIRQLNETIRRKKELHIFNNKEGELVLKIQENGQTNITTYKNNPIIPRKAPFS